MLEKDLVSIILPVYNGEKYIKDSIESVLKQSYKKIELIIVDDGSIDNTKGIIQNYDVQYVYQKNQGPSRARNKGLEIANGEYIAFIDADDIYLNNKIENQVQALKENPQVDVIYNNVIVIDENGKRINKLKTEIILENKEDFYAYLFFRQLVPCPSSAMMRKKILKEIKYPENYINAEDYLFTLQLAKKHKFKYINEDLYLYRRHNGNLTNEHEKQVKSEMEIIKKFSIEYIKDIVEKSSFNISEKKFLIAKIFIKIEQYEEALSQLKNISEKTDLVYFYMGNCYLEKEEYEKAKMNYEKAIKINGEKAEYFNNLGVIYKKMKYNELANINFQKALNLKKDYLDAKRNLNAEEKYITKRELRRDLSNYDLK